MAGVLDKYQTRIKEELSKLNKDREPQSLYEPINYLMSLPSKRLRPSLVLLSGELFGGDVDMMIKPALAIEAFHNFTLMHDDIMDCAPLRRGQQTVHTKYNTNTGILSGDALLINSYQYFEDLPAEQFKMATKLFSEAALKLCEGQQMDIDFENQAEVSYEDYLKMITYKTGVLTGAALKLGALLTDAPEEDRENIDKFGQELGIAFQIKDDYLDLYGTQEFGKKHAGDIYENKKTIFYHLAMQKADEKEQQELRFWYGKKTDNVDKVYSLEKLFKKLKVADSTLKVLEHHNNKAQAYLDKVAMPEEKKLPLRELSKFLLSREN